MPGAIVLSVLCFCYLVAGVLLLNLLPLGHLEARGLKLVANRGVADEPTSRDLNRASAKGSSHITVPVVAHPGATGVPGKPPEGPIPDVSPTVPAGIGGGSGTSAPLAAAQAGVASFKAWNLLIPVQGVVASQLRDSFNDSRSEGRTHRALDIMSQAGTPVLATADGVVRKLHNSARGGITLYQLDSSGSYVYCYAHLQGYADSMHEGKHVKRGEVIAYVGDTGNAGPGNYHLHFGISTVPAPGKWSGGEAINPYPLLAGE